VLSPGVEPAEPLACVLSIRSTETPTAQASREKKAPAGPDPDAGVFFTPPGAVLRRPCGKVVGIR
jgi:hypothetical protein